jgi:hypothetical protein
VAPNGRGRDTFQASIAVSSLFSHGEVYSCIGVSLVDYVLVVSGWSDVVCVAPLPGRHPDHNM